MFKHLITLVKQFIDISSAIANTLQDGSQWELGITDLPLPLLLAILEYHQLTSGQFAQSYNKCLTEHERSSIEYQN